MNTNKLLKLCKENPDVEIFVANKCFSGGIIEFTYHELNIEQWEPKDPKSHFVIFPGDLVSG